MRRPFSTALTVLAIASISACTIDTGSQDPAGSTEPSVQITSSAAQTKTQELSTTTTAPAEPDPTTPQQSTSQPAPAPSPKPAVQPRNNNVDANCSNCVAITYDDGPGDYTQQLLNTLKAKNAQASFMVLANRAYQHPDLLQRMKAEGHTIGNHTMNHPQLNQLGYGQIAQEIDAGNAAIRNATGEGSNWLRPPYGATNATVDQVTRDKGISQVLWNVDTLDWKIRDSQHVCNAAVSDAQAGSIVLMHDIHTTTVNAADCVIDGLRAKGLEPVSLDQLLPQPAPGIRYYSRG